MTTKISSGGVGAILSTMKHANEKTGLFRSSRALLQMNSPNGFDCPGCAWPEPKKRSKFEFCENGAKTLMNATTRKMVDNAFFKKHSVHELISWSDYQLSNCGRLVQPAVKFAHDTHFKTITYDDAFAIAARHFAKLRDPNRAVFYTSGRASNEAAFLYQLFARMLGTNNLCDCSNLCHESSGVALTKTIGVGKGTVQIEDFENAKVIFLIGHNPSSNHPRMLTTLREARKNGARIVVINPLLEPGLVKFRHPQKIEDMIFSAKEIATDYFLVNVGGDHALFLALLKIISDSKYMDMRFIHECTDGFADLQSSLDAISLDALVERCGLNFADINAMAKLISEHDHVVYAWGMGITQTTYAVNTIEAIVNLALLRGHIGKSYAGLCPVRGHSNVQGNRTVGITERPSTSFLTRLANVFGFTPPTHHGLDVVNSIHAMINGDVDIFMALGGNFLSASPDTNQTARALKNTKLALNISTSLNRTHLLAGETSLIIPCLTRVEKDVQDGVEQVITVENSMSIVHASRGHFAPIDKDLLSEVAIIANLASNLKLAPVVEWKKLKNDYGLIRNLIAQCLDDFFEYNERIKHRDGFLLKNPWGAFVQKEGRRARFSPVFFQVEKKSDYDVLLTTIRSHDQFNTSIYGLNDRYRNIKNEREIIFMSHEDIMRLKLHDGMRVDIVSRFLGVERIAHGFRVCKHPIKAGNAAAYFPEANVLVPLSSVAYESNTPTSKLIPVVIRPSSREESGMKMMCE